MCRDVVNLLGIIRLANTSRIGCIIRTPALRTSIIQVVWIGCGEELTTSASIFWHVITLASGTTVSENGTVCCIGRTVAMAIVSRAACSSSTLIMSYSHVMSEFVGE